MPVGTSAGHLTLPKIEHVINSPQFTGSVGRGSHGKRCYFGSNGSPKEELLELKKCQNLGSYLIPTLLGINTVTSPLLSTVAATHWPACILPSGRAHTLWLATEPLYSLSFTPTVPKPRGLRAPCPSCYSSSRAGTFPVPQPLPLTGSRQRGLAGVL